MAQTYSTLRREAAHGRVYSSQYSSATVVPPLRRGGLPGQVMVPGAPVAQAPVAQAPLAQAAQAQAAQAQAAQAQAAQAQAAQAQAPVAQAPVAQAPVAQAPVAQAPVAQAPVAQAPVAQPPVAQLPAAQVPPAPVPAPPDLAGLAGAAGLTAPMQAVPAQGMPAAALQAMPGLAAPTRAPSPQGAASRPADAVLQAAAAITQSLGLPPNALPPFPALTAAAAPASVTFNLETHGLPAAAHIAPGGASGTLTVAARPGGGHSVTGTIQGVRPLNDPVLRPVGWLIHDLTVPYDLSPADVAALPRGRTGTGNQPGTVFTIDGNAATYTPECNTISICISPGSFTPEADGTWKLDGTIDGGTNLAFHPLALLGPAALADINAPLPTGTSARILTDLFMRSATVHPELNGRTQFPQRLMAIVRDVLGNSPQPAFLTPDRFARAAVAIEGLVRSTPSLMPSRDTTFLLANQPATG